MRKALALTGDTSALSDTTLLSIYQKECKDSGIEFVHGTGKYKQPLQRIYEECEAVVKKRLENEAQLEIMGERNSYSKTDNAATFMRMKKTIWAMVSSNPLTACNLLCKVNIS